QIFDASSSTLWRYRKIPPLSFARTVLVHVLLSVSLGCRTLPQPTAVTTPGQVARVNERIVFTVIEEDTHVPLDAVLLSIISQHGNKAEAATTDENGKVTITKELLKS